jgi:hypothetical protein
VRHGDGRVIECHVDAFEPFDLSLLTFVRHVLMEIVVSRGMRLLDSRSDGQ